MRFLREPLLHFVLIGGVLFAAHGWLNPAARSRDQIVVTQARVEAIVAQFENTWQRPPSPQELRSLVDSWIGDEILYREGQALGLDRDDPVIKRRVRQKYEVISEESLAREPPSDADLAAYLDAHADAFRRPTRVSFEQLLIVPEGSAENPDAAVATARAALAAGADPSRVGQSTMLVPGGRDLPLDVVARDFGERFAAQLESVPTGDWVGPVTSSFGVHLVRVSARSPGSVPSLAEVRVAVAREWESARRREARETQLRALRERYDVVVDADLAVAGGFDVAVQ